MLFSQISYDTFCQMVYLIINNAFPNDFSVNINDFGANELQSIMPFLQQIISTVIILNIGTDRSEQTVQTQIRLLLMEQSDHGLLCLLFCLHLLNTKLHCKIHLFQL